MVNFENPVSSDKPRQEDLDRCVHCGLCLNARPTYRELGVDYLDRLNHHRIAINLTKRLRAMGYEVQITAQAA